VVTLPSSQNKGKDLVFWTRKKELTVCSACPSTTKMNDTLLNLLLYYLGAEIDAVGGELMSTPLHWATRHPILIFFILLYFKQYQDVMKILCSRFSCVIVNFFFNLPNEPR
jgi:hypothetical protein